MPLSVVVLAFGMKLRIVCQSNRLLIVAVNDNRIEGLDCCFIMTHQGLEKDLSKQGSPTNAANLVTNLSASLAALTHVFSLASGKDSGRLSFG